MLVCGAAAPQAKASVFGRMAAAPQAKASVFGRMAVEAQGKAVFLKGSPVEEPRVGLDGLVVQIHLPHTHTHTHTHIVKC